MSITLDGNNSSSVGVPNTRTAQTASGTAIDFTGIPSGTKRITLLIGNVSTSGTSAFAVQLGDSGGIETTSYTYGVSEGASRFAGTTGNAFQVTYTASASYIYNGIVQIALVGSNLWVQSGNINAGNGAIQTNVSAGSKTLSGTLDRIRLTTLGGTDTFDAGTVNIIYE